MAILEDFTIEIFQVAKQKMGEKLGSVIVNGRLLQLINKIRSSYWRDTWEVFFWVLHLGVG